MHTANSPSVMPRTTYVMVVLSIPIKRPLPSEPTRLISLKNIIAKKAGTKGITEYFTFI